VLDWTKKKILVTGSNGFLGSRIVSLLKSKSCKKLVLPTSSEFDLRDKEHCRKVLEDIDVVFHIAGIAGGINFTKQHPASVFYDNLMMGTNIMEEARLANVEKFITPGTVCSYPKFTSVPFREEDLWNGYPEETNASYGLSKKMQIVQSQAYRQEYGFNSIVLILTNVYGPGDNFDPNTSNVIPSLIRKMYKAKMNKESEIELWGDGSPSRDFIHVQDAAETFVLAAEKYDKSDTVNIGGGIEITISELAKLIMKKMKLDLIINWNTNIPNGQPKRKLDISKAKNEFGFYPKIKFEDGIDQTIDWFIKQVEEKKIIL